ncbi:hypothetical protein BFP77_08995 [Maribacter sp. 4U21]|uniref:hypothetical protein n=1 Tax=Maribacter sp. 4U21 TaxID=1889779 RepID=UPI000C156889|nr:hypothetical protein [Maribacter sp. 4U21]PIB28760.1 hypothetical protein BFP77_08995 [Maribacter sp. 4U21]
MKTFFKCLVVCILFASCSKIEINDDPVIGIWQHNVKTATNSNKMTVDKEEWIFNDVYLGRFHGYNGEEVTFLTDFRWTVEDDIYTISYPGTDFPDDKVKMVASENGTYLVRVTGSNFATKQN